jgi:methionyl-tRNA formyltransferase
MPPATKPTRPLRSKRRSTRDAAERIPYLVAGCKSWNQRVFAQRLRTLPGRWKYVGGPGELTPELVRRWKPRYIFFLHWSWKVPTAVLEQSECVCFHLTDVPYGRGGSPLQNLIIRGHRRTKLTALRMTDEIDAGPVYLKRPLALAGTAEEILTRASVLSARMIATIIRRQPRPRPQRGAPTIFKRRKPEESLVPALPGPAQLYDFIRMLDAEGYPKAQIHHGGFRYEFSRAALRGGRIMAHVAITPLTDPINFR